MPASLNHHAGLGEHPEMFPVQALVAEASVELHGVRRDKFLVHLKECEWRWNHRRQNIYKTL